jgi:hypothetical protein
LTAPRWLRPTRRPARARLLPAPPCPARRPAPATTRHQPRLLPPTGEELLCAGTAPRLVAFWHGPGLGGRHRHVPVQVGWAVGLLPGSSSAQPSPPPASPPPTLAHTHK